jgi:hypothetical protein
MSHVIVLWSHNEAGKRKCATRCEQNSLETCNDTQAVEMRQYFLILAVKLLAYAFNTRRVPCSATPSVHLPVRVRNNSLLSYLTYRCSHWSTILYHCRVAPGSIHAWGTYDGFRRGHGSSTSRPWRNSYSVPRPLWPVKGLRDGRGFVYRNGMSKQNIEKPPLRIKQVL